MSIICDQPVNFRWHRWKRFRLLVYQCYRSVICLSVCMSRSCIVLKRRKISTRFLLHTTAPCLFQIALKSGIHRLTRSSPNFAPKSPHLLIWGSETTNCDGNSMANCGRMVRDIAQRSQWRAYMKLPSLFRPVPRWLPTTSPDLRCVIRRAFVGVTIDWSRCADYRQRCAVVDRQ